MSARVAVVNEAFARSLLGGQNPVGKRFWVEATPFEMSAEYEIVGMVRNTKYEDLREDFQPIVFQAQSQDPVPSLGDAYLIHSRLPMDSLIPAVRATLISAGPEHALPVSGIPEQHPGHPGAGAPDGFSLGGVRNPGRTPRRNRVVRRNGIPGGAPP